MAEMAAAAAAMDLGAHHAIAAVGRGFDRALDRIVEARPAGAALELRLRHEQRLVAPGAHEGALALLEVQGATSGRFGPVPAHHVVLLRGEQAPPLLVAAGDLELSGFHRLVPLVASASWDRSGAGWLKTALRDRDR